MRKPKFREVRLLSQDHICNQEAMEVGCYEGINTILHAKHNLTKDQWQPGMISSQFWVSWESILYQTSLAPLIHLLYVLPSSALEFLSPKFKRKMLGGKGETAVKWCDWSTLSGMEGGHKSGKDVCCQWTQITGRGQGQGHVGRRGLLFSLNSRPTSQSPPSGGINSALELLKSQPAGEAHIQRPPWMEKEMWNVCTKKKEERKGLPLHAKLEQKRNANRNPEMHRFRFGSCSFLPVTCQLPKQEAFFKGAWAPARANGFHYTIRSLLVLQNIAAPDNTLYSVNPINRMESFSCWNGCRCYSDWRCHLFCSKTSLQINRCDHVALSVDCFVFSNNAYNNNDKRQQ